MVFLNKFLSRLVWMWDPRPALAKEWLESAEKYEERLRSNQSANPQIVEAVLQERNRICALFNVLLPEFAGRISVVVTKEARIEHCAVFSWNNRVYVLVSGALLGRPYDHPEDDGLKAWQWLARHEIAHVRGKHLPWFFHTRRLFRFACYFCGVLGFLSMIFPSNQIFHNWLGSSLWVLGGGWLVQTMTALFCEWKADLEATRSINNPSVLKEAEKSLCRMGLQARECWSFLLGWIQYAVNMVFIDSHPPLAARRLLLRRRLCVLERLISKKDEESAV